MFQTRWSNFERKCLIQHGPKRMLMNLLTIQMKKKSIFLLSVRTTLKLKNIKFHILGINY